MQFPNFAGVALLALLASPVLGCKCYTNGVANTANTKKCCSQLHGNFQYGNDCQASSISEHLSNFRSCCGGSSDCDYPSEAEKSEAVAFEA